MYIKLDKFINYTLIAMVIIWPVLQSLFFFDGASRIPSFVALLCLGVNLYLNKGKIFSIPYLFWFLWFFYVMINSYVKDVKINEPILYYFSLFRNAVLVYVVSLEFRRNKRKLLNFINIILIVYIVIANRTLSQWDEAGRLLSDYGNIAVLILVFFVGFNLLRYQYKLLSLNKLVFFIVLALYFIVIGATRKALGGVAIVVFMFLIANFDFKSKKTVFFVLVSSIVIYFSVNYIMENTILGERFDATKDELELRGIPIQYRDHWFFNFVGGRTIYYLGGWQVFLDNIWTGCGITNYKNVTHTKSMLHTEYMVQLAECGLIGTTLYLLFMGWMAYNLLYVFFNIAKRETLVYAGMYGAILFISFTAWTYSFPIYFIAFGVIIGYCKDKRFKEKLYENRDLQKRRFV